MTRYSISDTTDLDLYDFYGDEQPKELRKAWTIRYDGEIACISGIRSQYDYFVLFSDLSQGDYPKSTIFKVSCWIITRALELEKNIIAIGTEKSHDFLVRLGLLYCGIHDGQRIYRV